MTVKHVRAASVPPAMNRNSVTGAAAAKISRSARSAATLMRVHTIISPLFLAPYAQKVWVQMPLQATYYTQTLLWNHSFCIFLQQTISIWLFLPFPSVSHPTADLLSLSSRLHIYHICRKGALRSPETEDLWILRQSLQLIYAGSPDSPALDMDEACSRWKAGYHDKPGKSGSSVRPEEKYPWCCSLNNGWIHKAPHHHLH